MRAAGPESPWAHPASVRDRSQNVTEYFLQPTHPYGRPSRNNRVTGDPEADEGRGARVAVGPSCLGSGRSGGLRPCRQAKLGSVTPGTLCSASNTLASYPDHIPSNMSGVAFRSERRV